MPVGFEIYSESGIELLGITDRYPQIIEVIDLSTVATPGSRSYPGINPERLGFVLYQGGGRARSVNQSGTTVSWAFVNTNIYRAFDGAPKIVVVSG